MTTPVKSIGGSFLRDEPVLATGIASSAVAWVLAFLVQDGIITDTQSSTLSKALVPIVASAIVLVITFVARHWVVPAWKALESSRFGAELSVFEHALSPADFDKVRDMLTNGFTELESRLVHKLQPSLSFSPATATYGATSSSSTPQPGVEPTAPAETTSTSSTEDGAPVLTGLDVDLPDPVDPDALGTGSDGSTPTA